MPMEIPPWLDTRQYDPVGTFLRAYQTGAQISEAQTRLAEQQRQANMEAQARQEQLQQSALHDLVNVQVTKAYHDQQTALAQAALEETKKRNADLATNALNTYQRQLEYNRAMEAYREREVSVKEKAEGAKETQGAAFAKAYQDAIAAGKTPAEASRLALTSSPALITPTTVPIFGKEGGETVKETFKPSDVEGGETTITGAPAAVKAWKDAKEAAKKVEEANKEPGVVSKFLEGLKLGDVLKYQLTGKVPATANAPAATMPGTKSPYPEGTILRKKDGSRWIVKNGEAVPYAD